MTQGEKLFIDGQLEEAYDVLLNEASEGSGRAMYLLGEYAKHGYIAPADKKLAKRYAEEGKKAGDLLAALNVGYASRPGTLTQKRIFRQYMPQVEALAKTGDVLAMYEMADVYRVGLVRKANEKKRWAWNKKCMKAGLWQSRIRWASRLIFDQTLAADVGADGEALLKEIAEEPKASAGEAARLLAEHYLFQQDFKRSFYYSELAVRWKNIWGWFYLGLHYAYGYGVKVDLIKAENALAKAYDWKSECAGDAAALLGEVLLETTPKRGIAWLRASVKLGNVQGMFSLGCCLQDGRGCKQNIEMAEELLEKVFAFHGYKEEEAAQRLALLAMDTERYGDALKYTVVAAKSGRPEILVQLAQLYHVEGDFKEALFWYKKAFDMLPSGSLADQIALCCSLMDEMKESAVWVKKAAELGSPLGMLHYAQYLLDTLPDTADASEPFHWFKSCYDAKADPQMPEDMQRSIRGEAANMAGMCSFWLGDQEEANAWYQKAYDMGDVYCLINLGNGALQQRPPQPEEAIHYLKEAWERGEEIFEDQVKGDIASQISAAYRMKKDWMNTFHWANQAAALDNETGMIDLGMMHLYGNGTPVNHDEGLRWLVKAYEKKGPQAKDVANYLGIFFQEIGDMAKAEEWYKKSAALGSDWGMMNLGLFYQHGLYGEPDLKRAKEWFEKAIAVHGDAEADVRAELEKGSACPEIHDDPPKEAAREEIDLKSLYMPWLADMKWKK